MQSNMRPLDSNASLFMDVPLSRTISTAPLVNSHDYSMRRNPECPQGWWSSLVWRLQGGGKPVPGWWDSCKAIATSSWLNILLVNVPLAWTAAVMDLNPLLVFGLSFLALVPLEKMSEFGGNQFSLYCGETLGEFVSITLANVVEVNLAIFLLFECQLRLVQATVIGVILLHALLVPGIAFLIGGARVLEQQLKPVHTQLNSSLLFLGVVTLLLPAAFFSAYPNPHELIMVNNSTRTASPNALTPAHVIHVERALPPLPPALRYVPIPEPLRSTAKGVTEARRRRHRTRASAVEVGDTLRSSDGVIERNPEKAEAGYIEQAAQSLAVSDKTRDAVQAFSHGFAIMLMLVYVLSRIYLHRHPLNDDLRLHRRSDVERSDKPLALPGHKRRERVVGPGPVILLLIIIVGLIAVTAEFLVQSIEHVQQVNRLSSEWFGLILLPMISYSADALVTVAYCCRKAYRHRFSGTDDLQAPEELARGRSIDLSIQFLLFWLPMLVVLAWVTNKPLTLLFDVFEVAAAIGACLLVNYATQDGKTNWVEGVVMIVFYMMIALAAWFYNGQLSVFELLQCQSVDELVRTGELGAIGG